MHIKFLQGYDPQEDVCIRLHVAPGSDHRCYNLPTADEVAVILPTNANPEKTSRDTVLYQWQGGIYIFSDLHPAYVPLYYVILFPYGENGWHPNLQIAHHGQYQHTRMTQVQFVSYHLQSR